jgi:glycosyltransferase involved in cell wall biosynthesis
MMEAPLVTAVIPAFNGERYLAQAIESVLAQVYRPLELVVIDDGSTDASRRIAASYRDVRLVCQENAGVSAARNAGAREAKGSLLAFLDQDDRWTPEKLSEQVPPLVEDRDLDYSLGHQRIVLEDGVAPPPWLALLAPEHVGHFPGTLVVRREAYDRIGGFRSGAEPGEGADWFLRANEAGLKKTVVGTVVLLKRLHDANQSGNQELVRRQVLTALRASVGRRRGNAP